MQQQGSFAVSFALFNSRSIKSKSDAIVDYVVENSLDILALTETWLTAGDSVAAGDVTPEGYRFHCVSRDRGRGGGIGVLFKRGFAFHVGDRHPKTKTFESTSILLHSGGRSLRLLVVYRPPRSTKNPHAFSEFLLEFIDMVDGVLLDQPNLLIVGDFNVHVDDPSCDDAAALLDSLAALGLAQHVSGATHSRGHTLDLIISRSDDNLVDSVKMDDLGVSDHLAVTCNLCLQRPHAVRKHISQRSFRTMDIEAVCQDLSDVTEQLLEIKDAPGIVSAYNRTLTGILDRHAPLSHRTVTVRPNTAWYTQSVHRLKQERRVLERIWRKSGLEVHRQAYCAKRLEIKSAISAAKRDHYSTAIENSKENSKDLFRIVDRLLHRDQQLGLPLSDSSEELAERFSDFFTKKIESIRSALDNGFVCKQQPDDLTLPSGCLLSEFRPATNGEVRKLLMSSPAKSCDLDPFPTWLLKKCEAVTVPILTHLINSSLTAGFVDPALKTALVRPLLKRVSLDNNDLKNYRPISNLPFASKLLEKVIAARLAEHLTMYDLEEPFQSAYRPHHSVESAIIRVQSDILQAMDCQRVVVLVMLDLSAAFDTIDHQVLLQRLSSDAGVSGTALRWFQSYLAGRTQSITINNARSRPRISRFGVPQGSVLGPRLFSIYTVPLGSIIEKHGLKRHFYADDTQVYFAVDPRRADLEEVTIKIAACVSDLREWMARNFLKLNDDKTDIMLFGSVKQLEKFPLREVPIGTAVITPADKVRNLGITLDPHMTMSAHVSRICSMAYYHLRDIGRIRPFLTVDTTERLVHAFVTSRLDMGNALLYGIARGQLQRLQRIQNSAARLVTGIDRRHHIKPVLQQLHWLPVEQRIHYKLLLQVYRALNGLAPAYIAELLQEHVPCRELRSASRNLLVVPPSRTTWGDRSFRGAAPQLWNSLPAGVRRSPSLPAFKNHLKTHLYFNANW